ncbi:SDR family oxidoreductase [Kibdelosporangium philippinense]|uniref:SDR family oxidoreductase n=1 Tax=Kibdelosporangium philippinense TaxID=211113 RepID=A0ABS8Z746_9PSEU|nr:SDR family oxidoreductase [Kibdelosporangium philippinense]MCE7002471.1 SDR family oxidoreductase [Kibdelosporangium philippinense]
MVKTEPGMRVLVTGAAGGIGRATCEALVELKAHVIGVDLPGTGADVEADLADDTAAANAVAEAVERLGGLDALVGVAGKVDTLHRADRFPVDAFRADVDANLSAQFFVAQAAFPHLRGHGTIVFFSSLAARDGLPGQAAYAAAKAGVLGLTRTLAGEWADAGIRVNAIMPGLVATPKVLALPPETTQRMLANVPLGRLATLDELAGTVIYLLSPASGYMTGQALRLDGGAGLMRSGLHR